MRQIGAALCGVGLSIGTLGATAAPWATEWHDLRPATVAAAATVSDDPFERLSAEQIELLRRLTLSRNLEARGALVTDEVIRARGEWTRQLAEQGLDADALLARRETLIAERRAAAESVNAALEGRAVSLRGFLVPVAVEPGRAQEFLLVPWVGACSHADRPPPNQIVRVRPVMPQVPGGPEEPAQVEGTLRLQPTLASVFLGDGTTTLRSAYLIDDAVMASTGAVARRGP